MKTIKGNILNCKSGIIVHQINCKKVMGAGLALQIRKKYPEHYTDYMQHLPKLGDVVLTQVKPELFIAGVYGQYGFGQGKQYTDYEALRLALTEVEKIAKEKTLSVYIPYGLGCGLAGGNWNVVNNIVAQTIPDAVIVRL